jgi:hypothetical protein
MNEGYIMFNNYRKISLDDILEFIDKEGRLKFLVPTYIALPNIEATILALYIGKIIDMYSNKIKEIDVDILQWGSNTNLWENIEKRIFIEPRVLYKHGDSISFRNYYLAFQPNSEIYREKNPKIPIKKSMEIREVKLDISELEKMVKRIKLEYLNNALNYLKMMGIIVDKIDKTANILAFWGIATLYYISEVLKYAFGISNHKIERFSDIIDLSIINMIYLNRDIFYIFGYQLLSEYKGVKIRFRIYDASDIYLEESIKYKVKKHYSINPYIALSLYSSKGYILFEGNQKLSNKKIRKLEEIKEIFLNYPITLFEIDSRKLIEKLEKEGINEKDYVSFIGDEEYMKYIINNIKDIYRL